MQLAVGANKHEITTYHEPGCDKVFIVFTGLVAFYQALIQSLAATHPND